MYLARRKGILDAIQMPSGIVSTIASEVCACNSEHIWAHLMQLGINYFIFIPNRSQYWEKKGCTVMHNDTEPAHLPQNECNYI